MRNFLDQFKLSGDGTGFWDAYEKNDNWLGNPVVISIAVRSMSEDIYFLFDEIMKNQSL